MKSRMEYGDKTIYGMCIPSVNLVLYVNFICIIIWMDGSISLWEDIERHWSLFSSGSASMDVHHRNFWFTFIMSGYVWEVFWGAGRPIAHFVLTDFFSLILFQSGSSLSTDLKPADLANSRFQTMGKLTENLRHSQRLHLKGLLLLALVVRMPAKAF